MTKSQTQLTVVESFLWHHCILVKLCKSKNHHFQSCKWQHPPVHHSQLLMKSVNSLAWFKINECSCFDHAHLIALLNWNGPKTNDSFVWQPTTKELWIMTEHWMFCAFIQALSRHHILMTFPKALRIRAKDAAKISQSSNQCKNAC